MAKASVTAVRLELLRGPGGTVDIRPVVDVSGDEPGRRWRCPIYPDMLDAGTSEPWSADRLLIDATEDALLDLLKHEVEAGVDRSPPAVEVWTSDPRLEPLLPLVTFSRGWADEVRHDQAELLRGSEAGD